MKKHFTLVICCILIIAATLPARAQDSVDPQLLNTVQTAFTNLLNQSSFTQNTTSTTEFPDTLNGAVTNQGSASYQLAAAANGWNISGTQTTTISAPPGGNISDTATTSMELVIVDGISYIRFTAVPEFMQSRNLPQVWTALDQSQEQRFAGMKTSSEEVTVALNLPLDASGITALTETAADTIDGQAMRVFQITFDSQAVMNSGASSLIGGAGDSMVIIGDERVGESGGPSVSSSGGGGVPSGAPDTNSSGGGSAPPIQQGNFQPPSMDSQITATVWVGSDGLVHRITIVVTSTPTDSSVGNSGSSTVTTTIDFTDFNQSITIAAPTVGT